MKTSYWKIHPDSYLRAEDHSVLWFQRLSAETLELELAALPFLLKALKGRWVWRGWSSLNYLKARGFLRSADRFAQDDAKQLEQVFESARESIAPLRSRRAPEVLHLALTDACQQSCSGCFFSNQSASSNRYLSPQKFADLIQEAADHRIFQLALGGGEPLMHPRLVDFVQQGTQQGLVVNLTSNGALLNLEKARALKQAGLGQFQLSLNGAAAETHQQSRPDFAGVMRAISLCQEVGLRWGLNVLVTRANLAELEAVFELAQAKGARSVNILRPKMSDQDPSWLQQNLLDANENLRLQKVLQHWQGRGRFLLQTDTSLSFLRSGSVSDFERSGLGGCSAGRRMLSVQVDGRFAPCSHMPWSDPAGGLIQNWTQSQHLQAFREVEEHLQGQCKSCKLKAVCRGCRAIVLQQTGDFYGADTGCPKHQSIFS